MAKSNTIAIHKQNRILAGAVIRYFLLSGYIILRQFRKS